MEIGGKILTGAAATALLALIGHAISGETFISGLEQKAQTELAARGLEGASVSFSRDPLSRNAVLDGDLTDISKDEALDVVKAIAGVSGARWLGDDAANDDAAKKANTGSDGDAPAADSATQAKIAECQNGVDKVIEAEKINFRSGSAYLSPEANKILDKVAAALKPCDGLSVSVEGHTDNNGPAEVNKAMSQERANRVKAALVERGLADSLISATGYGPARPIVKGADAQNRRIEFRIAATNAAPENDAKAQQEK